MNIFQAYGKEIISLLVPFIAWILSSFFKTKAKLQVALPHQFTYLVQEPRLDSKGEVISPNQTVHTNSFIIRNDGREAAEEVELVFNWKPMCLNLWPVRHYQEHHEPDSRYVLIFDAIASGENLYVEVLSVNHDLPSLLTVRSANCVAKNLNMYPQPLVSDSVRKVVAVLLFLGLATAVYLIILLIQFLVLQTPLGR